MDPATLAALMRQMNLNPDDLQNFARTLASGPPPGLGGRRRAPPSYRHGMSDEETKRYFEEYKEWFEEDRNIPPEPAPRLDRNALIAEQVRRRVELESGARARGSGIQFFMTMVGFPKHSSSTSISELTPSTY